MPDKEITCCDCKAKFVLSEGEQQFFVQKGFALPRRCKPCRQQRKAMSEGAASSSPGPTNDHVPSDNRRDRRRRDRRYGNNE